MTSREIRQQFLDFFAGKGHTIVPSSPVVPADDPTLMFTNAGMNQFKDVFLGTGSRPFARAADTQKCIRAGGKHNDLDDVGQDTYHHTFFEMLGNWSFGDYFKKEAIEWAWELLTGVWGIEKDRLYATYFEGDEAEGLAPDDEAARLWKEVTDIDPSHVVPGNKKDNFWEMGDTGPCGPCSEIHIDLTPDKTGGPLVNAGDHRVIEIWNLVFIQFNRAADGKLSNLPSRHVDTGMGFERLCAVLQGMAQGRLDRFSNYDTDVFTPIFAAIQKRTGAGEYRGTLPSDGAHSTGVAPVSNRCTGSAPDEHRLQTGATQEETQASQIMLDVSYRVIADHVRCLTFALTDGAVPSNEGRGYVLRRILRRAVRYGRQYLNMHEPFLCDLVEPLVDHMGDAFPELRSAHNRDNMRHVVEILRDEEESFGRTFDRGLALYREAADHARKHHHGRISGEAAFKLHDTYGFTIDLTELMAEEDGLTIDIGEYERLMEEARVRAQGDRGSAVEWIAEATGIPAANLGRRTDDSAKYTEATDIQCNATYLFPYGMATGQKFGLVFDQTCFYAEQGGQAGDLGWISGPQLTSPLRVGDCVREGHHVLHVVTVSDLRKSLAANMSATLIIGGGYVLRVDTPLRRRTMQSHTSTHILNWALREVLGEGVQQKGSLVDPEKTRFDFSHNRPVTVEELERVEGLANQQIEANHPVYTQEVDQAKALRIKTLRAVFGEQYPERVRVVSIGAPIGDEADPAADTLLGSPDDPKWMKYPVEFCGGTHLANSGEAERFVLISEEGVAKGIRRVVGISGKAACEAEAKGAELLRALDELLEAAAGQGGPAAAGETRPASLDVGAEVATLQRDVAEAVIPVVVRHRLGEKLAELRQIAKKQAKQQSAASGRSATQQVAGLLEAAETVNGVTIVVGQIDDAPADALRGAIDWIRNKTPASAVLLASASGGKVTMVAGMSKEAVAKGLKAGDLVREVAPIVGGRGGGKPEMAQAGGQDAGAIPEALDKAKELLRAQVS